MGWERAHAVRRGPARRGRRTPAAIVGGASEFKGEPRSRCRPERRGEGRLERHMLGGGCQCDDVGPCLGGGLVELVQDGTTGDAVLGAAETLGLLGELCEPPSANGAC